MHADQSIRLLRRRRQSNLIIRTRMAQVAKLLQINMGRMHAPKTGPQWRRGRESTFPYAVEEVEAVRMIWVVAPMGKDERR